MLVTFYVQMKYHCTPTIEWCGRFGCTINVFNFWNNLIWKLELLKMGTWMYLFCFSLDCNGVLLRIQATFLFLVAILIPFISSSPPVYLSFSFFLWPLILSSPISLNTTCFGLLTSFTLFVPDECNNADLQTHWEIKAEK